MSESHLKEHIWRLTTMIEQLEELIDIRANYLRSELSFLLDPDGEIKNPDH